MMFVKICLKKGGGIVKIDTRRLVSMTEANQNFSRVARLVNENGSAVILKNNHPRYLVLDFQKLDAELEQMLPAELLAGGGSRG